MLFKGDQYVQFGVVVIGFLVEFLCVVIVDVNNFKNKGYDYFVEYCKECVYLLW